jgi:hypothetical protein
MEIYFVLMCFRTHFINITVISAVHDVVLRESR